MSDKSALQQDIYNWISKVKVLVDEGYELGDRVGALSFSCLTTEVPDKFAVITSPSIGSTLSVGDSISWTLSTPLGASETVDVFVNGIDQGPSTTGSSYTLTNVPSGAIEVCLKQLINGSPTGVECCYEFVGQSGFTSLATDTLDSYDFNSGDVDPMTVAALQGYVSPDYNALTGDVNLLSVDGGELCAEHPIGSNADLNLSTVINVTDRAVYLAEFEATVPANWVVANPTDGGKLGWGLSGGSYPFNFNGTIINRIMGGGSTATTGHSQRWGFRGDKWGIYSYHINRPGMPGTGAPVYGEDLLSGVTMNPGQTYQLAMELTMNTAGVADGIIRGYIDGVLEIEKTGVEFMDGPVAINRGLFSSNNGGAGVAADNFVWKYDNFVTKVSPT